MFVKDGEVALVCPFKTKATRKIEPGIGFKFPWDYIKKIPTVVFQIDLQPGEVIGETADEISCDVDTYVTVRVENAIRVIQKINWKDKDSILKKECKTTFRAFVKTKSLSELNEPKNILQEEVGKELQKNILNEYGFLITNLLIERVKPPKDVVESRQMKQKKENEIKAMLT